MHGRTIETTLGELTDDASENNTKLTFKVNEVASDSAYTEFITPRTHAGLPPLARPPWRLEDFRLHHGADDGRLPRPDSARRRHDEEGRPLSGEGHPSNDDRLRRRRPKTTPSNSSSTVSLTGVSPPLSTARPRHLPAPPRRGPEATLEARPEEVAAEEEAAVDVDEEDVDVEA